jgi:hypothetical protein
LAGWAIVVGMAVSVRASEVRVAQQLGMLASFPPLGVVVLLGIGVIHPTFKVAVLFAIVLLALDVQAFAIRLSDVRSRAPRDGCQSCSILSDWPAR